MKSKDKTDFLSTTAGILTSAIAANLLWGSASTFIKLGYRALAISNKDVMSQILFAGVRFTLAGLLTVLIGSILHRRVLLPSRSSLGMIVQLAMVQTVIQYTFFYIGLSNAPGYKGSIISPTAAFFAILIAALVFRQEKLTAKKLIGCFVGFAGVAIVNMNGKMDIGFRLNGEGFLVFAAASYGCSSVLVKRYSAHEDPVILSGWQFALGGAVMALVAFLGGGRLTAVDSAAWPIMVYLAFVSAVAYTLWSLLLQRHTVSRIMVFTFLNPVFGVFLSALLLGELRILNIPRCLIAIVLVCLGVWIVNRPEPQK